MYVMGNEEFLRVSGSSFSIPRVEYGYYGE